MEILYEIRLERSFEVFRYVSREKKQAKNDKHFCMKLLVRNIPAMALLAYNARVEKSILACSLLISAILN